MFVVDYLQLLTADGRHGSAIRSGRVNAVSEALLTIAQKHDTHGIALSQLSRNVEGREDKRPRLSDLRDSGRLEEDADNVLMMYPRGILPRQDQAAAGGQGNGGVGGRHGPRARQGRTDRREDQVRRQRSAQGQFLRRSLGNPRQQLSFVAGGLVDDDRTTSLKGLADERSRSDRMGYRGLAGRTDGGANAADRRLGDALRRPDDGFVVWPSVKQIADDTCMSRASVQRWMRHLEERKLVERFSASRETGAQSSNRYRLPVKAVFYHPTKGAVVRPGASPCDGDRLNLRRGVPQSGEAGGASYCEAPEEQPLEGQYEGMSPRHLAMTNSR
jgi:hypothetical protein